MHYIHFVESNHRMGRLEEAATDLSVAFEMTGEDDAKANICQKLVRVKLIFPQPFTVKFNTKVVRSNFPGCSKALLQVLTYQLSGQVEDAQMWTQTLKSHLESMGISKQKKVNILENRE